MFLDQVMKRNPELINAAVAFHKNGVLEPDTYVIDYDQTMKNAKMILDKANTKDIKLYFMLKQLGRNPLLAKALVEMGYCGAVVVDFREAEVMMEHHIPLGNVGHLVQTPRRMIDKILAYGTEVFTVFTFEKLVEINESAQKHGIIQDVILKVYDEGDVHYRSQEGGVSLEDLESFLSQSEILENVKVVGATSFPAFLYSEATDTTIKTQNYTTIYKAIDIMRDWGCEIKQINVPSTTSVATLDLLESGVHGEPGHGLTGTTPAHAKHNLEEVPSAVYLSEISHNFKDKSYAYGGGYYRRSHVKHVLVVDDKNNQNKLDVVPMSADSIDYYFELTKNADVSASVIMAFRFQIFVTRSRVALVQGISKGTPEIMGIFDSLGKEL